MTKQDKGNPEKPTKLERSRKKLRKLSSFFLVKSSFCFSCKKTGSFASRATQVIA